MLESFMVARDGQQYGPYSKSDLLQYLRKGEVLPEDLVWSEGMTEWKALQDVVDLSVSNTQHSDPISGVKVDQISENEVIMHCSSSDALLRIRKAMELIGSVSASMTDQRVVSGKIKYGLQSVKIRVSIVERELGKVNAVIQGSSDDIRGVGAKSAAKRLIEVLRNLDNPGYKPDRLGVNPVALAGLVIGVVMVVFFLSHQLFSPHKNSSVSYANQTPAIGSKTETVPPVAAAEDCNTEECQMRKTLAQQLQLINRAKQSENIVCYATAKKIEEQMAEMYDRMGLSVVRFSSGWMNIIHNNCGF